jgi:hypothetical protein
MRHRCCFIFKPIIICFWVTMVFVLQTNSPVKATAGQSKDPTIKYTVISQRWLTKEELRKFEDVIGYRIAIKLRLSNDSDKSIEYLASSLDNEPRGYSLHSKIGTEAWEYIPHSRGRTGNPGTEFTGIGYTWRVLQPHSSVEGEILSYTAKDQEFAFSTFIQKNSESEMREVVSDTIRPLSNR